MICGRMKMISSVRCPTLVLPPNSLPNSPSWSISGRPVRLLSDRSLIRAARSTGWALAPAVERFTRRCDTQRVRREAAGAARRHVGDFLLEVEQHVAVGIDARHAAQDHAGVAIVDGVDHR